MVLKVDNAGLVARPNVVAVLTRRSRFQMRSGDVDVRHVLRDKHGIVSN